MHEIIIRIPEDMVNAEYYIVTYTNTAGIYHSEKLTSYDGENISTPLSSHILQSPSYREDDILCQLSGYKGNIGAECMIKHSPIFKLRVSPSV